MTTENIGLEAPAVEHIDQPVGEPNTDEQPTEQATTETDTDEAPVEGAVEFKPGEKYVPLSAVIEARQAAKEAKARLKELEPASQEAKQLREYLQEAKPYIEFLKANPQFLQPQQAAPARQPEPQEDAEAVEYAKEFDLYTADGKPDAARARRIIEKNAKIAQQAAAQATAPVAEQMESQAVLVVLQQLKDEKDGDGNAISPQAINALATGLVTKLGRDGARRFIANPQSYELLQQMAWGAHAKIPKKQMPKAPETPPLPTERAGGKGEEIAVSTQHLGRLGLKDDTYKEAAKRYRAGQNNVLE